MDDRVEWIPHTVSSNFKTNEFHVSDAIEKPYFRQYSHNISMFLSEFSPMAILSSLISRGNGANGSGIPIFMEKEDTPAGPLTWLLGMQKDREEKKKLALAAGAKV